MSPLEAYLTSLREIRSSGEAVDETSYYDALANLLNEIGKSLKPRVRCVLSLKNRGAGIPDGGLFTDEQLKKSKGEERPLPQIPARGVIEVKPTSDDAWITAGWITADSEQVSRYWGKYRQVLVTNYRDFVFVGQDAAGKPVKLESYRLADSEKEFWASAAHPKKTVGQHGPMFVEFAQRALLHAAPIASPEAVAWFLASYARDALARIGLRELPALASVRKALEEALGLAFEGEKGEHFFRSTLIQTLFYGVFSAWVLWSKKYPPTSKERFDWRLTAHHLRVPVLRKLFHEVADPGQLEELNLAEILDWTASVLNRVDRASFFSRFQETHAVQYFYEPFLQAFDPDLRKQLGVWYTPPEIVQYMVARVDTVLREELDVADGLADKNVYVLDPCCGTGSYLVEVLSKIHETLKQHGDDALVAADLKDAAKNRVFGFELLPAPFVVSHLQIGLLLQNLGAPLAEKGNERVGVFLTNALTGWEPPKEPKKRLLFSELEEERDAAEHVKRDTPILVILGNPPYNAFAGVSPQEEHGLVEPYKEGLVKEWKIKKFNLDDLYVRFFRLAERRITERNTPGKGVLCFISNFSYLGDPSFVVMRKRFLNKFDAMWFDCMNGDSRETGKLTPDGKPDPSVFSTAFNREGIRVGTAIGLLLRKEHTESAHPSPTLRYRGFWGRTKNADLMKSLGSANINDTYEEPSPTNENRFSLIPAHVSKAYLSWPKLTDLSLSQPFNGPVERRGNSLIVFPSDRQRLFAVRDFLDPTKSDSEIEALAPRFMKSSGEYSATKTRRLLKGKISFSESNIRSYPFKPFDVRLAYLDGTIQPLFSRPSPELLDHARISGNYFLISRDTADKTPEGPPFYFSRAVCDYDSISGHARHFPLLLREALQNEHNPEPSQGVLPLHANPKETGRVLPNISMSTSQYLASIDIAVLGSLSNIASLIWSHVTAIGYSPQYLDDNHDGIRQDWPRIPLPNTKKALVASAELGNHIAALLDSETPLREVTGGDLRAELRLIGMTNRAGGGNLKEADLPLTAGWGHAGKDGVTMPGNGRLLERQYSPAERKAVAEGAKEQGLSEKTAFAHLGNTTCDVYLNDSAYWSNIPIRVWEYTIGGYQVIKKWLSYREEPLLGRPLTIDEVRYVQEMARRIAAILLLEPALDANYASIKSHTFPWPLKS